MLCSTSCILWLIVAAAVWLLLAAIGALAERRSGDGGRGPDGVASPRPDLSTALAALLIAVYLRLVHRMRIEGVEHLAAAVGALEGEGGKKARGLVVTANHAAGIDPLLVQSAVGGSFFIRWLAAADTVSPLVQPFVEFADVIFLKSSGGGGVGGGNGGGELAGVREAIRYVQGDPTHTLMQGRPGVIGLFPEGRIARRSGVITPFQPGIGLIIARSRGLVLPVVLRGVPVRDNTYRSFFVLSRATVEFKAPIDYAALGVKAGDITAELQGGYEKWVGPVVAPMGRTNK